MSLLHVLAIEPSSEDLFFFLDYSMGATSLGRGTHSFVMPWNISRPLVSLAELQRTGRARRERLLASIRSSGDPESDSASLAKTAAEIEQRMIKGPWRAECLPTA